MIVRGLVTLSAALGVFVCFWILAHPSHGVRRAPVASQAHQPTDPVTGIKMNWITFLYRHTEEYQEERKHEEARKHHRKSK